MSAANAADFWSKFDPSEFHPAKVDHGQKTRSTNFRARKQPGTQPPNDTNKQHQQTMNIPDLLHRSAKGLSTAAKCLAGQNRDAHYNINKIKWSKIIYQKTLMFSCGLLSEGGIEVRQRRIPAQAKIDELHNDFIRMFQTLFVQLASVVQKPNPPDVDDVLVHLVKSFMAIRGQEGGRQEKVWVDALDRLQKLLAVLDYNQVFECLQEILGDRDVDKLARYNVYSMLFEMVLRQYEDEWIHGHGVCHWELVLSRLRSSSSMIFDFKALVPSTPDIITHPTAVTQRLRRATNFSEGHYFLSQAFEAEADIFDQTTSTQKESQFNKVHELYSRAHKRLMEIDKANAGLAVARIGILRWKLFPPSEHSVAIEFLMGALAFENDAEPDAPWLRDTRNYIAMYNEEQKAKEEDRLRKEREEQKRQERRAQKLREMEERERENKWLENLETLRDQGDDVETRDELVEFLEWMRTNYDPPEVSAQTQLQQQIGELKLGQSCSAKLALKRIIRLYHPDKNRNQGEGWKTVSAEVTKVLPLKINHC